MRSYSRLASISAAGSEVTMKRGLASPSVHSALPMTRRMRLHLSKVDQRKSLKRRAGLPVLSASARAAALSVSISARRGGVGGQAEDVVHAVGFAPRHQRLAAEAAVGAQQNAHPRPAGADLADDARHFLHRSGRAVDVGAAQLGRPQVPTAEDVERQVAVAVVIAMEEPAFLLAMQRVIGGIEIECDLCRSLGVGIEEQIDEQGLDGSGIGGNAGIAGWLVAAEFEPVQRAFARQRRTVAA